MTQKDWNDDLEKQVKPQWPTSPKVSKIAGITILVLSIVGLLTILYLQIAHATQFWPFG